MEILKYTPVLVTSLMAGTKFPTKQLKEGRGYFVVSQFEDSVHHGGEVPVAGV